MKIYLVGGAVRDALLGRKVTERDYVVVGATEEEMVSLGYQKVGRDFPVFLHPETKEEYALARQERKIEPGYKGFTFDTNQSVTLEEDLLRRDLTVNAMAQDEEGHIFDPYGGQNDLKRRLLRHVSPAFIEDPLRVLRVARFAARYANLGFSVAPETNQLMYQIVKSGEMSVLVTERIWAETEKALSEKTPSVFFKVLRACGALANVFPEIDALFGVPQTKRWHPEIDTGVHTMMVLDKAATLSDSIVVRFAALVHDLGKATTSFNLLPSHHGHDKKGVSVVNTLCCRLRVPKSIESLGVLVSEYHTMLHKVKELTAKRLVMFIDELDAYRRESRFNDFITVCQADALGRKNAEEEYPQADYLRQVYQVLKRVSIQDEIKTLSGGEAIKRRLHEKRVQTVKQYLKEQS